MDLFVRKSNDVARSLYTKLGYTTYRTVVEYYSGANDEDNEDAYGTSRANEKERKKERGRRRRRRRRREREREREREKTKK